MPVTLITGGARSGKSLYAERLALQGSGCPFYIPTALEIDEDMEARVRLHRDRRGADWIERPVAQDLAAALAACDGPGTRLVDCLTLWLSGLMMGGKDCAEATRDLTDYLARDTAQIVFVTSEVGLGIVPDNALARAFQDRIGLLNQAIAEIATEVTLVVAGQGLRVK
jgi:adenosylcobinamide kinase/adenosylcobinamide-phosphate guanylyltransferase